MPPKEKKKKEIFKLRSFAHEVILYDMSSCINFLHLWVIKSRQPFSNIFGHSWYVWYIWILYCKLFLESNMWFSLFIQIFYPKWKIDKLIHPNENFHLFTLQAQRDYFGAHTYELVSDPGKFIHTNWTGLGGSVSSTTYDAWVWQLFSRFLSFFFILLKNHCGGKNGMTVVNLR